MIYYNKAELIEYDIDGNTIKLHIIDFKVVSHPSEMYNQKQSLEFTLKRMLSQTFTKNFRKVLRFNVYKGHNYSETIHHDSLWNFYWYVGYDIKKGIIKGMNGTLLFKICTKVVREPVILDIWDVVRTDFSFSDCIPHPSRGLDIEANYMIYHKGVPIYSGQSCKALSRISSHRVHLRKDMRFKSGKGREPLDGRYDDEDFKVKVFNIGANLADRLDMEELIHQEVDTLVSTCTDNFYNLYGPNGEILECVILKDAIRLSGLKRGVVQEICRSGITSLGGWTGERIGKDHKVTGSSPMSKEERLLRYNSAVGRGDYG